MPAGSGIGLRRRGPQRLQPSCHQAPPADPQPLEVQGRRRVGRRPAAAFAYWPPLQSMTCPVMKLASSEARKAIAAACSSGVPRRFSAWRWRAS